MTRFSRVVGKPKLCTKQSTRIVLESFLQIGDTRTIREDEDVEQIFFERFQIFSKSPPSCCPESLSSIAVRNRIAARSEFPERVRHNFSMERARYEPTVGSEIADLQNLDW